MSNRSGQNSETATAPRPFAFVLMPFDPSFGDTYELAIKPACEAAGAYAERVDQQVFQGSILQRIYNQIAKADVVIADMTGKNANVFYETGYAHALGKAVILLTRSADDIPFDLKHFSHLVYGNSLSKLKNDLESTLRRSLEARSGGRDENFIPFNVSVNLQRLTTGGEAPSVHIGGMTGNIKIYVIVENPGLRFTRAIDFQLILFTPQFVGTVYVAEATKTDPVLLSTGWKAHALRKALKVLPGSWERVYFWSTGEQRWTIDSEIGTFGVRVITRTGFYDFVFTGIASASVAETA
jgi:hypothetical protein